MLLITHIRNNILRAACWTMPFQITSHVTVTYGFFRSMKNMYKQENSLFI